MDEDKIYCCPECDSEDLLFPAFKDLSHYFFICQDCGLQFVKPKEKEVV